MSLLAVKIIIEFEEYAKIKFKIICLILVCGMGQKVLESFFTNKEKY
jgi:hypothetical protein